jgi:VCBS repeat-containing protein
MLTTDEDTVGNGNVLTNDTDVDSANLTAILVDDAAHGTLDLDADGSFTYAPDDDYYGSDSFTYKANDGSLDSNTATVSITVKAVNDAPVADNDTYTTDEDTDLTVSAANGLLDNDTDVENDQLHVEDADANTPGINPVSGPSHGQLTLNADGSFTYMPDDNYNGSDSFTYRVCDNGSPEPKCSVETAKVNITINPINDAPVAVDDSLTTDEDTAGSGNVLNNDTDVENDNLTAAVVNGPAHGTLALNADGSYTYTPDADYNGTDSFTYKANDGSLDSNEATVSITVRAVNDAPVAKGDSYNTDEDTQLQVAAPGVLDNDEDVDNVKADLNAVLVDDVAHGELTLNANGSFTYTPNLNFFGEDSFTYKANDGELDSEVVTVSITVNAVNDAPVAKEDTKSTFEDEALTFPSSDLVGNDDEGAANEDGQTLAVTEVSGATHGTVSLASAGGNITFTPEADFNGDATFDYTVCDNGSPSECSVQTAVVTVKVDPVNDAPSFTKGDNQAVNEDAAAQTITGWATAISAGPANESDQTVSFTATNDNNSLFSAQPEVSANGTLSYTPAANANGVATVSVKIHDDGGTASGGDDTSDEQTFTIEVSAVNDAPSFQKGTDQSKDEDAGAQSVPGWASAISSGPSNESDQTVEFVVTNDNDSLFTAGGQPAVSANGTLSYTSAPDANGTATVSVKIHDDGGTANGGDDTSDEQTFTITVNSVNDAPVAEGDNKSTNEDEALTFPSSDLVTNDDKGASNESAQELRVTEVSNPTHGTVSLASAGGNITFTPEADFNGDATFQYTVCDNGDPNECSVETATVKVIVSAVNDAPSFTKGDNEAVNEDAAAQTVSGWATAISAGPANESDQAVEFVVTNDNDSLFTATGQPAVSADGTLSYAPAANANGTATVSVKIHDDGGTANGGVDTSDEQTFTITVNAVNDVPSFQKGADQTKDEDAGAQSVPDWATAISAGPANESGQAVDFIVSNNNDSLFTTGGQPAVSSNGTLSYTLAPDANGTATVSVKIHDDGGTANDGVDTSAVETFTITVNAVNDAPVAKDDTAITDEDTAVKILANQLLGNDSTGPANESGQKLTIKSVSNGQHGQAALNNDGSVTFTPAQDFYGEASFDYTVCDDGTPQECYEGTAIVKVTVSAVNDAPVAKDDAAETDEDTATSINVITNDTDVDNTNAELSVSSFTQPAHGVVTKNADGTLKYEPAANYNGPDSFTYRANDGSLDSNVATVNITVKPVNDAPAVSDPLEGADAANEGDTKTYTFNITDIDSNSFTFANGYPDCGGPNKGEIVGTPVINGNSGSFQCRFLDGLASPSQVKVSAQVKDGDQAASNIGTKNVSVSNVAPTVTGITSSSQNVLVGPTNKVTFTGTATDPSGVDTTAGFNWKWALGSGSYGTFGEPNANTYTTSINGCGPQTVSAIAKDKDGGVSAPFTTNYSVNAYTGSYKAPLVDGTINKVQKGQVVPVKISVGCGTTNLTGLSPHIQLLNGNNSPENETGSTAVTTSVSSADTGQIMRPVDGGYIYNLRVPSDGTVGKQYTIRVNPFGADANNAATGMYIVLEIRK